MAIPDTALIIGFLLCPNKSITPAASLLTTALPKAVLFTGSNPMVGACITLVSVSFCFAPTCFPNFSSVIGAVCSPVTSSVGAASSVSAVVASSSVVSASCGNNVDLGITLTRTGLSIPAITAGSMPCAGSSSSAGV